MIRQKNRSFKKSEITTKAIDGYLSCPAPKTVLTFVENILRTNSKNEKLAVVALGGNPDDPAFRNTTKLIGATYLHDQAKSLEEQKGWHFRESKKNCPRLEKGRTLSPIPKRKLNLELIGELVRKENIVVREAWLQKLLPP